MLSTQDVETQLTQRRLDIEALELKLKQANSRINSLLSQVDTLGQAIATLKTVVNNINVVRGV